MQNYEQTIRFLETLINIPSSNYFLKTGKPNRTFFIKRIGFLLDLLGNPEQDFKYIHITGTSGKSSLVCFLQSILAEAGHKTGAYFSPHATKINERIKVNNDIISNKDICRLTEKIKPALAECARSSIYGVPSYLETLLTIGFLYFREQKCEYIILEAGCGGLFDATNIIKKSEVSIITNVGLDHTEILGQTKEQIAKDKSGIIKNNSYFITGEQNKKIQEIFKKKCSEKKSQFNSTLLQYQHIESGLLGSKFIYNGREYEIKLAGFDQINNAILAIDAANLIFKGSKDEQIYAGLKKAWLPCRLQVVQENPTVILDGAHNPSKLKSAATLLQNIKHKNIHLIIGLAESKDLYNTLKYIVPLASNVYLTRFLAVGRKSKRLGAMWRAARKLTDKEIGVYIDPWQALDTAINRAKKSDIIIVTGSFFLAGELRKRWLDEGKEK